MTLLGIKDPYEYEKSIYVSTKELYSTFGYKKKKYRKWNRKHIIDNFLLVGGEDYFVGLNGETFIRFRLAEKLNLMENDPAGLQDHFDELKCQFCFYYSDFFGGTIKPSNAQPVFEKIIQ